MPIRNRRGKNEMAYKIALNPIVDKSPACVSILIMAIIGQIHPIERSLLRCRHMPISTSSLCLYPKPK